MPEALDFYQCGRCGFYHQPSDERPQACKRLRWRAEWLDSASPQWRQVGDPDDEVELPLAARLMRRNTR